ncbi:MAG: sodium/solute symporter [Bryobacterales bacterium]|nr:sodium/solute symporter [Bryobacteraceae bacterium]MDW8355091.1 sodium/solute symporter [Bryobacterales bacterium]
MRLGALDLAVIVLYLASLSLIGVYFSRRQVSREEYLLGRRRIHWLLAAGSVVATLLSTLTYLSVPGEMIRYGLAFFTGLLGLPLAIPVVTRILLPKLTSLGITSMYEYLEQRYSAGLRRLAAAIFSVRTLTWMALVVYSCSLAVAEMTGWNLYGTIAVTGLLTTFYAAAGGLRTVIWTDNLQLWILAGGAIAIPASIWIRTGMGPAGWWELFTQAGHADVHVFSLDPTVRLTVFSAILSQVFWSACTQGSDQLAMQRYLATPSLRAARRTAWAYLVLNLAVVGLLVVSGLALFAFYYRGSGLAPAEFQRQFAPRADTLLARFIVEELPAGAVGLLLAALLAAAMSSFSSGINSLAAVVSGDLLTPQGRRARDERASLRLAKAASTASGLAAVALAMLTAWAVQRTDWNLIDLSQRLNHLFVGPLAVLFFAGLLLPRVGVRAALGGFLAGSVCSVLVAFGSGWLGLARPISFTWLVPGSFVTGFGTAMALGALRYCKSVDGMSK